MENRMEETSKVKEAPISKQMTLQQIERRRFNASEDGLKNQSVIWSLDEIHACYNRANQKTNGFTQIRGTLLLEDQTLLKVFRMATHADQAYVARLSRIPKWIYQHYELGLRRLTKAYEAQRIADAFQRLLHENNLTGRVTIDLVENATITVLSQCSRTKRRFPAYSQMQTQDFEELYDIAAEWTDNFKKFPPMLLIFQPQSLFVYRSVLGMQRTLFSKMLDKKRVSLERRENGDLPFREYTTAKMYMQCIKAIFDALELTGNVDKATAVRGFIDLKTRDRRTKEEIRKSARKAFWNVQWSEKSITPQEKFIITLLEQEGIECYFPNKPPPETPYHCAIHGMIYDGYRMRSVDLVAPDCDKPRIIAECRMIGRSSDEGFVRDMDHVFEDLRVLYPNAKLVAILQGCKEPLERPPPYMKHNDAAFVDSNLLSLPSYVKEQLLSM